MDQQVVGGTIEADFQFPWVIDVSGTLTGKGVLIAPTWVLTAAHVVETSFGGFASLTAALIRRPEK